MSDTEIEVQTATADRPFAEGDVVQLKSGGCAMTFRSYTATGDAYVMYATIAGIQHAMLPVGMLRFARNDVKPGEGN